MPEHVTKRFSIVPGFRAGVTSVPTDRLQAEDNSLGLPFGKSRRLNERILREDIRFREEAKPANMRYSRYGVGHEKNDH